MTYLAPEERDKIESEQRALMKLREAMRDLMQGKYGDTWPQHMWYGHRHRFFSPPSDGETALMSAVMRFAETGKIIGEIHD